MTDSERIAKLEADIASLRAEMRLMRDLAHSHAVGHTVVTPAGVPLVVRGGTADAPQWWNERPTPIKYGDGY